jgi:transcriptional regulator with XRE-family HTH domain
MSQELYEKCREIKETSNPRITNQDLAEATGKSERTVAQFLRGEIPNASCETVALICKEFGVSVDEHYGITMPEPNLDEQLTKENRMLESENHALKVQNVELIGEVENLRLEVSHQKEKADFLRAQLKTRRPVIYTLMCSCAVMSFTLLVYIILDANVPDAGFIRYGRPSAAALVVIAVIAAAAIIVAWSIIHAVRKPKKHSKK